MCLFVRGAWCACVRAKFDLFNSTQYITTLLNMHPLRGAYRSSVTKKNTHSVRMYVCSKLVAPQRGPWNSDAIEIAADSFLDERANRHRVVAAAKEPCVQRLCDSMSIV